MKTQERYPKILEIHPGRSCRLNCTFCYRKGHSYEDHGKPMDGNTLKRLIYDFAHYGGQELYISGGLEPFSDYETICHSLLLANRTGLRCRVYSNGTELCLQKNWIQELLIHSTEQIRFSVHARSEKVYAKITNIQDSKSTFTLVKENIFSLLERKDKNRPQIGIGFVVKQENLHELVDAARFWSKFGIDFMDVRFDVMVGDRERKLLKNQLHSFELLVGNDAFSPMKIHIGDYNLGKSYISKWCSSPFYKLVVDPFGIVWPCCFLAQPGIRPSWANLGCLNDHSYEEIISNAFKLFPRRHCDLCTPFEIFMNKKMFFQRIREGLPLAH
jgi:MoaA/NifB/PqqE/SkfB family radical SAM enzyme